SSLVLDLPEPFTAPREDAPVREPVLSAQDADRNTFIAAARRAARSQSAGAKDEGNSLIGRAFARMQNRDGASKPAEPEAKAAAPEAPATVEPALPSAPGAEKKKRVKLRKPKAEKTPRVL